MQSVVIVDYGTGNVSSVGRALANLGCDWVHSRDPQAVLAASHLILPGVGHGGHAMATLEQSALSDALTEAVHRRKIPVLGICLGMQLMTARTEEGDRACLGWFDQATVELRPENSRLKVPNIGWHTIAGNGASALLEGIELDRQPFYFCHRYGIPASGQAEVAATYAYGAPYAAILHRENLVGVQFHPEKSQEPGLRMLRNFLRMEPAHV